MKKLLILMLALLLVSCVGMAKTNYFDSIVIDGSFALSGTSATAFTGTTFLVTASTSAIFYTPSFGLGYDVGAALTIAVANTTGNVAITQTGSTRSVTWTAGGGFDFVGAISLDATTFSSTLTTENGIGAIVADKITVVEYMGEVHKSVFTFVLTGAHDLDLADGDHGTGIKVYDLPEGRLLILGATIDASVTTSANYNASPDDIFYLAMGTAVGADDNDLTSTEADIIPKTTLDTVGATALTLDWHAALAASAQFDGTTTPVDLYVNAAIADTSNSDANTYAITGTGTITWINLGDY